MPRGKQEQSLKGECYTNAAIYVLDTYNKRVLRADRTYAAEETIDLK